MNILLLLKQTNKIQGVRCVIVVMWMLLMMLTSCVSLRNNYLGKTEHTVVIPEISIQKLIALDSNKLILDRRADSILYIINSRKHKNKALSAREINQLYSNFADQLDYDRVFNVLLHRKNKKNTLLSSMERYAGVRLLVSAAGYTRCYGKNHAVRRSLNRGDQAHNIPPKILHTSRNFLYSPAIRKTLKPLPGAGLTLTDSLLLILPHTNMIKSVYYRFYSRTDIFNAAFYNIFHVLGQKLLNKEPDPFYHRPNQRKYALQLLTVLQPYDILLMKSPNIISNQLTPGYFGHASVWLGNEGKRKNRHKEPESSKSRVTIHTRGMAEAVKSGVKMSSLRDYADGETYLVMRLKDISPMEMKLVRDHALSQMGKNYDFNFDINSPDEINCTELVYLAYDFINWKVDYFLGRYTIFPDDLLTTAQNDKRFEIVAILKNGILIEHPDIIAVKKSMHE